MISFLSFFGAAGLFNAVTPFVMRLEEKRGERGAKKGRCSRWSTKLEARRGGRRRREFSPRSSDESEGKELWALLH